MKNLKYYLSIALCGFGLQVLIAQQMNQEIHLRLDSIGDAHIIVSMTMNAGQWEMWNNQFGNNPASLKREMERAMPAYFLNDFKLEKDDMNRSFKLSLKAYGLCEVDRRGRWIMNTDQKNANPVKLGERTYTIVQAPSGTGGQIQQTYIIDFPEEASDIKIDTDSFDQSIFKFKMKNHLTSGFNYGFWGGILLVLMGLGWLIKRVSTSR